MNKLLYLCKQTLVLASIVTLGILTIVGSGGGGGGGDGDDEPPVSQLKIDVIYNSAVVLPTSGGLLLIEDDDNELNGASLDIPAGAVAEKVTMSIGTIDELPAASPFGQQPVGKLFGVDPPGLLFQEDTKEEEGAKREVILSLPIPPGEAAAGLYIGRWNDVTQAWEDLGGTVTGDFISTEVDHLSAFGVFYSGKSYVKFDLQAPLADLGIQLRYVNGPAVFADYDLSQPYAGYRPLPPGGVLEVRNGEPGFMMLLPGRYHFVVSYPHPQPGQANSLFFDIPVLLNGGDDYQIDQTIVITLDGARSDDSFTDASMNNALYTFPGYQPAPTTLQRPVIACTAVIGDHVINAGAIIVRDRITGVAPVFNPLDPAATRLVDITPVKVEQLDPTAIELVGTAHDPEGSLLKYFWTWEPGTLPTMDAVASDGQKSRYFYPNPIRGRLYTVSLTVYDEYGLFDQCSWFINVVPNTPPIVKATADDIVIDFGRRDVRRTVVGPTEPQQDLLYSSFPLVADPPPGLVINVPGLPLPLANVCAYAGACPFPAFVAGNFGATWLATCPNNPPVNHVDPLQYVNNWPLPPQPHGATCVFGIIGDADGDPLDAGFRIPPPEHGRGTLYAAISVPNAANGGGLIPLLDYPPQDPPRSVADILPDGLVAGSIINTYARMDAYNATLSFLANQGLLPVTAPLSAYAPLLPLPAWPNPGPQALPVIWEAPDDPCPADTPQTHDCSGHFPDVYSIARGGTVNIESWVTDRYSPERRAYSTVLYPDPQAVLGGQFTIASITPIPAHPAIFESVTVTACLFPPTADVTMNFSMSGTDGYTQEASPLTDDTGCASMTIPGASEAGVIDTVNVEADGATAQVVYVFG